MKKLLLSYIFISFSFSVFSQEMKEIDSLSLNMCQHLKTLKIDNDSLKLYTLYNDKLYPFMDRYQNDDPNKAGMKVFYRLQRNCIEFRNLLDKLNSPSEKVIRKTSVSKSVISKKDLQHFKSLNVFKYTEASGDTTYVKIINGQWIDHFTNNTYSKLDLKWLSDNTFELIFIESNNETRANFSLKGDKFHYYIIEKKNGYYVLNINIPGQDVYEEFKLYF